MKAQRKQMVGRVSSNKMDKTVVVEVERTVRHRLYGKVLNLTEKYKAHDENNECQIGDIVLIEEARPMSREKRWRVVEILERVEQPIV
jgi:small subunit ribosomal protein S17